MTIVVSLGCFALWATDAHAEDLASGTCGANLTWVLTDDGTLTISVTGTMYSYPSGKNYNADIKNIVI